jgi:crotonobetainyl-CoA:carnitine CoA-transferase CaiB-like acyl-CoA transferase
MTAASMSYCRTTQWEYSAMIDRRGSNKQPKAIVRALDRWLCLFPSQHWWGSTLRVLGMDDLADDRRLDAVTERQRQWREIIDAFQVAVDDKMADDVVASVQAVSGVVGREFTPYEVVLSDQLAARSFWESVRTPDGDLTVLGPAFRLGATPRRLRGGPPRLNDGPAPSVPAPPPEPAMAADADSVPLRHTSRGRLRVLDLSTEWAGPMAARILATLGADVIHVEAPQRMDGWRGPAAGGHESNYPDREPGTRPYNRSAMFNTQNQGKRSLVIDLKTEGGRAAALAVAAECDIVLTNFRPGILERLGLGYDALRKVRDDIIVVQMPAFGSTGPMATHGAVGPTMELAAGMASLIGYGDGEPIVTGPAYMDPIGAYNGAAACMTALLARELGRGGQLVEMAQSEAGMHWIGEHLMTAAAGGEVGVPRGNQVSWAAPHDAFRAEGDDEWVVLAATTETEWVALCTAMERPGLATDPRFSTLALRLAHQVELNAEIVKWTHRWEKTALANRLQAAGVPAAPVLNGREVADSAYLDERGFFALLDHPEAGRHRYQGLPIRVNGVTAAATRPAPCFGEHSREVLTEVGGLSDARVDSLVDSGAVVATAT